jgi:hypothetical protein
MADKFEHFRLSLMVRPQADLFDDTAPVSREDYLRRVFSVPRTFDHYGRTYHYLPRKPAPLQPAIFGRIGRKVQTEENLPPDEDFAETTHEAWQAVVTVLDPPTTRTARRLQWRSARRWVGRRL